MSKIVTFTGYIKNNPLTELGDIDYWIYIKAYNFVKNIHHYWLLIFANLVIGKQKYLL
jgi:hypothetical protein